MPLIMDDDQYMNDLFGDSEPIQSPSPVHAKGLSQRLDELRRSGCCQKLAWSNHNCVASITGDGHGVELRTLVRKPGEGRWILSEAVPLKLPPLLDGSQLVHISWSSLGSDLIVVDAAGRVFIFTNGYALGRMQLTRASVVDQEDDLSGVVGMHWLPVFPLHQRFSRFRFASRNGNDWTYRMSQHVSSGPSHPQEGKSAVVYVTRNAVLRLLYQQFDGRWAEASTELESLTTARGSYTHAAFGADNDGTLILAVVDLCGSLQIFRVKINWKANAVAKNAAAGAVTASFEVSYLGDHGRCNSFQQLSDPSDGVSSHEQRDSMLLHLSHLQILPAPPEQGPQESKLLTILAVSSYYSDPTGPLEQTRLPLDPFSLIATWELCTQASTQHPSFAQLTSKKKKSTDTSTHKRRFRIRRHNDVIVNSIIINVSHILNHTLLAFALSDGSIEFRAQPTMELITPSLEYDKVYSMPQSGFAFATAEPFLCCALSPNFCAAATRQWDGVVNLRSMEYSFGSFTTPEEDPKLSAAIVALAIQHTYSCWRYHSSDDIFAVMERDTNPKWTQEFLSLAYQMLNTSVDYVSEESQKQAHALFRITPILKCLSAQTLFGSRDGKHRNVPGKFAWVALNIRLSFLSMSASMKENWTPEAALSLSGTIKWSVDLMVYIVDDLIRLAREVHGHENSRAIVQAKLFDMGSPALLLIITSVTRILIRWLCRHLRQMVQLIGSAIKKTTNMEHRQTYSSFFNLFGNSPITIHAIDPLLVETESIVKSAYARAGINDVERGRIEKAMLISCQLPEALMPAVHSLLTTVLDKFQNDIDPAKLYFADVRWLGLTDDKSTEEFHRRRRFDVVRKVQLKPGTPLRRCTRCCSYMVDFDTKEVKSLSLWTHGAQKICVCGSNWVSIGVDHWQTDA